MLFSANATGSRSPCVEHEASGLIRVCFAVGWASQLALESRVVDAVILQTCFTAVQSTLCQVAAVETLFKVELSVRSGHKSGLFSAV